jgi:hypothetical protein
VRVAAEAVDLSPAGHGGLTTLGGCGGRGCSGAGANQAHSGKKAIFQRLELISSREEFRRVRSQISIVQ